jgi:hypothetical protein
MTERMVSLSCEADKHDRCGGKTQWFKDPEHKWTQQIVSCRCACHDASHVPIYVSRDGRTIYGPSA